MSPKLEGKAIFKTMERDKSYCHFSNEIALAADFKRLMVLKNYRGLGTIDFRSISEVDHCNL